MDYKELADRYSALLIENTNLKKEIKCLKEFINKEQTIYYSHIGSDKIENAQSGKILPSSLKCTLSSEEKIKIFMSLFKGRVDVYARRWENKKTGKTGYSPVCLNEWEPGICQKPRVKCNECKHKSYDALNEKVIENHLRGSIVAGLYPMYMDETCNLLAIDFDDEDWQKDITTLKEVCIKFNIPVSFERSRSGNGAHVWFFFENPITAVKARKFGTALLTYSMNNRHEIKFKSYDRLIPNQDTMPKGGLGNLIALPLQKASRINGKSVFLDENFEPYNDQWSYLESIKKLSEEDIETFITKLCNGSELGVLIKDDKEMQKPWETKNKIKLSKDDFPLSLKVIKANMLFISKSGISQRALNYLKRLAAFKNPEFYKTQAMRMSTFNIPRIISCSDEIDDYLCLPRGCEAALRDIFHEAEIDADFIDKTNCGKKINVEFNGSLRDEQPLALNQLLKYDNGVLSATTAFGKTVVAIKLIAERKVNTLILVDRVSLVSQWKEKLSKFLIINDSLPEMNPGKMKGRKKKSSIIGQLGAGKENLNGIIDIAVMQSLYRMGEVKECARNYGMVIVDECHHVSAFSFEQILKNINAKYVYGLTATPIRKDGHHPIIFMQCGPIRYKDNAKKQAENRPFEHYVIPRFTSFRVALNKDEKDLPIQELYSELVDNEVRNQLIIDDVVKSYKGGRNCIILTERTAHVKLLAQSLSSKIPDVISLTGGMGTRETREILNKISSLPKDKQLSIVATGKYIGEGFDAPRLDTLFLAMPISWRGTLQQYAGRLHRIFEGKSEVQIYDYVDVHVNTFESMYNKRLSGYASIGYKTKGDNVNPDSTDIIFDNKNFLPIFNNDIVNAVREILIVSPFVTKRRTVQMMSYLNFALSKNIKVIVVTRPVDSFKGKDNKTLESALAFLKNNGVNLLFKPSIHQKFAVMDQKIVWYGSINLLSFGNAEESIMRLESSNIANELLKNIESRS